MKKLRIAILKREIHSGGGLEKYFRKIHDALFQRGHNISVLSMEKCTTIPVIQVCKKIPTTLLNMVWFDICARRWLRKNPQDIILGLDRHFLQLTHYRAGNGCHAAFLERRMKESSWLKRFLLLCNPLHRATLMSERRTFQSKETKIICNSHLVREEILRFYPGAYQENIFVLHNGVEWHEMEESFRASVKPPIPHLLFVGHEWQRKGLDRLLRGLPLVKTPFFLTAIGKERSPEKFFALVRDLNLESKVRLIPRAQNPLPFYQEASVMVIPSRYDPFANVTLEALAMGLFVVTTRANGGAEVLSPGCGIILREDPSPEELAAAVEIALVRRDREAMREAARPYDFSQKLEELVAFLIG